MSAQERSHEAAIRHELEVLHSRIAPRFGRPEVRERAARYLAGLVQPAGRRTGWQMAEQIGEERADGVQRLLRSARWDADAVRDDLRDYVVENLGDPSGVLVLAEIGFPKKGPKSVGVERWRNPTTRRIEHRQLGLFLAYASPCGWAFIDRALYLPEEWAEDEARRREAGVPEHVRFSAKRELTQQLLERAFRGGVPDARVAGCENYGRDARLRRWLEAGGHSYVLAEGGSPYLIREAKLLLPPLAEWAGFGPGRETKRVRKWARGKRRHEKDTNWAEWLLACSGAERPAWGAFHGAYGPSNTSLSTLIRTVNARWTVEDALDLAKGEVGLDQYEVRRWEAWHRYVTLGLLAHAALQVARARSESEGENQ